MNHRKTVAISIPTGIGAEIGGYAGDGGKIARMFAKYFNVITHPNVVNGGILSAITEDILYVEGFAFDEFFRGNLDLAPLSRYEQNKIGVIFDKAIPQNILNVHINTISALKEVKALDIPYFEVTEDTAGVEFFIKNSISTGILKNEETLLKSAKKLIDKGCTALAAVCYFGEDANSPEYEAGAGVDPIGGIEAVISHYLTKKLTIPIAHAPAFAEVEIENKICNPKVASENISSTYLPCVLEGLSRAPRLIKKNSSAQKGQNKTIKNKDVEALILPYKAFGGIAPIAALAQGIKLISVKNETKTEISCSQIGANDIIEHETYQDCLKYLLKDSI